MTDKESSSNTPTGSLLAEVMANRLQLLVPGNDEGLQQKARELLSAYKRRFQSPDVKKLLREAGTIVRAFRSRNTERMQSGFMLKDGPNKKLPVWLIDTVGQTQLQVDTWTSMGSVDRPAGEPIQVRIQLLHVWWDMRREERFTKKIAGVTVERNGTELHLTPVMFQIKRVTLPTERLSDPDVAHAYQAYCKQIESTVVAEIGTHTHA